MRVDKKVKEIFERGEVDLNREVKRFLEELACKAENRKSVEKLLEKIPPAEQGFSVKSVREDRESHLRLRPSM